MGTKCPYVFKEVNQEEMIMYLSWQKLPSAIDPADIA